MPFYYYQKTILIGIVFVALSSNSLALSVVKNNNKNQWTDTIQGAANLRPVSDKSNLFYRCATLDNLSQQDAECLLEKTKVVIDLRNTDEIRKGAKERSQGSRFFYEQLENSDVDCRLVPIPILQNVDAFWDEAIRRLPAGERFQATLQTAVSKGALGRAAARKLEQGGLPALYSIMLTTGANPFQKALDVCWEQSQQGGAVLFHCQKGKDRTGLLAMLIQHCLGDDDDTIIKSYGLTEQLMEEKETTTSNNEKSSMVDWSHFRGSPERAMADTLSWIREEYGSIDAFLDRLSFSSDKRDVWKNNQDESSSSSTVTSRRSWISQSSMQMLGLVAAGSGILGGAKEAKADEDDDFFDDPEIKELYDNPAIPTAPEERSGLVVLRVAEVAQFQEKILRVVANGEAEGLKLAPMQFVFGNQILLKNSNLDGNMKLMIYDEIPRSKRNDAIKNAVITMNTLQDISKYAASIQRDFENQEMIELADMYRTVRINLNQLYEYLPEKEKEKYYGYFVAVTEYEKKIAEGTYNPELDGVLKFDDWFDGFSYDLTVVALY